jgi:hypothetical protein
MDWANHILEAQRAGYTVSEDDLGWWITTPKAPRRASETLGVYRDSHAAWRGAALIHARYGRDG